MFGFDRRAHSVQKARPEMARVKGDYAVLVRQLQ
jgi:hypothetical protein